MTDLFWPGDERAGAIFTERHFLDSMVAVEEAWSAALAAADIAPARAAVPLLGHVQDADVATIAARAEQGGTPVLPLLDLLRDRLRDAEPSAADWLHRGLTSQDVVDSALMICTRDCLAAVTAELRRQIESLVEVIHRHRGTAMVARTLTQHAVPTTFAIKCSTWLDGLLDAAGDVAAAQERVPVQLGGAAGTLAAAVGLADRAGAADPADAVGRAVTITADRLGLVARAPWHTNRTPVTVAGRAMVGCTDAWGRVAGDVLIMSRPEIGELSEGVVAGRGGSSAMPHKRNPVLAVLVNRAGLAAPTSLASLHLAAATVTDERPPGSWHVEWSTLRTLGRHSLTAARQTTELLAGLEVHPDRMAATLAVAGLATDDLRVADANVDALLDRAAGWLGQT